MDRHARRHLLGSPETNVDTSENRQDFIEKLQRLKQQVLDGIGQEKNEEDTKSTDGQQQIMVARAIFTSDTNSERTITVGNWNFECHGASQLKIHNVEGEQVSLVYPGRLIRGVDSRVNDIFSHL